MTKMLTKRLIILFLGLALMAGLASCKKDDEKSQDEIDQEKIEKYIKENNLETTKTASGLHYIIYKPGNDKHPDDYSYIFSPYRGYFMNGEVFDAGELNNVLLGALFPGVREGLKLIGEGGEIKLILPASLGDGLIYKDTVTYSIRVFDFELDRVINFN
jgi:FKBP-type peptidyl-prolyl cis-trans isomerase FkpA